MDYQGRNNTVRARPRPSGPIRATNRPSAHDGGCFAGGTGAGQPSAEFDRGDWRERKSRALHPDRSEVGRKRVRRGPRRRLGPRLLTRAHRESSSGFQETRWSRYRVVAVQIDHRGPWRSTSLEARSEGGLVRFTLPIAKDDV